MSQRSRSASASAPSVRRSRSVGSVDRSTWRSESLAGGARAPPRERCVLTVSEMNNIEEVVIGSTTGAIRLEQCVDSRSRTPTSPRRLPGSKYSTPFGLREPVTLTISQSHVVVRRAAGDEAVICKIETARIGRIAGTDSGISFASHDTDVGLSVHDATKRTLILKLMHARCRGAPPPAVELPVTVPLKPRERSDVVRGQPRDVARIDIAEPRTFQASSDREARRTALYAQLNALRK